MSPDSPSSPLSLFARLGVWFVCCLALAAPICFAFGKAGSLDASLRFALLFALPVWLLYIPLILTHQRCRKPQTLDHSWIWATAWTDHGCNIVRNSDRSR